MSVINYKDISSKHSKLDEWRKFDRTRVERHQINDDQLNLVRSMSYVRRLYRHQVQDAFDDVVRKNPSAPEEVAEESVSFSSKEFSYARQSLHKKIFNLGKESRVGYRFVRRLFRKQYPLIWTGRDYFQILYYISIVDKISKRLKEIKAEQLEEVD